MKNQPFILVITGLILTIVLFLFGRTTEPKSKFAAAPSATSTPTFNIKLFIDSAKARLTPAQSLYVSELENGISRGDVPAQQMQAFESLASFWEDSVKLFEPYAHYTYEASKLDNSEKKLTFAAQLFLQAVRGEHDQAKLGWLSKTAIELFEKALKINPENEDLKIGLGSSYIFGTGRTGDPQQTMRGIQELLSVVRKDSTNMKAQFVLGVGGYVSAQYDKAIERFTKVISAQPDNMEAIAFLADTYAAQGDKPSAIKWYNISKRLANNPLYSKEVDERIKMLK